MSTREFHDTIPVPSCHGASCGQGRRRCSTPDACRLAEEDSQFGALEGLTRGLPYLAGAWAFIAAVVALAWWLA